MKKFYIPTSTLNFNNILSSESISPKAFYDKRSFGYSRWAKIPENPFDNATTLYDNLCYFERPKCDIEDHPLLIEVLLDETRLQQAENFWYCDYTIYLAPTTTRFLFYTETDRTITRSMSESSLETKLVRLYERQIQTIQKSTELYKPISLGEPCGLNELEIEKDIRTNKLKGMLYGYYIGSLLSSDLDSVQYLNALKEIHNIFAAILSSSEKRPTDYQSERLDELFKILNNKNADYQKLLKIIGDVDKTSEVLNLDFVQPRHYARKKNFLLSLQAKQHDTGKDNPSIAWIKSKIAETKHSITQKSKLLQPDKSEIVVRNNSVSVLKNENITEEIEKEICLGWFNVTLSSKGNNGKISTYKGKLADDITDKAKEILDKNWGNSEIRTYLNALRHHVAGDSFNQAWNNGILASMAAVVVAGDDWEKLLAFMQNKEMTDYKLAFAFYGELNGFANLTRDFTDLLYNQESKYVWEVYKEFYGQLIGERITEIVESDRGKEEHKPVAIQQTMLHENAVEAFPEAMAIKGHAKYSEKKHGKFIEQIIAQRITDWDRIKKMSKSKDWVAIINELSKSAEKMGQNLLFPNEDARPSNQFFYLDKGAFDCLLSVLPKDKEVLKQFKIDLDWFQHNYQNIYFDEKKGETKGLYRKNPQDNASVIENFERVLKGKLNNPKAPWLRDVYNKIDINMVINKLKELYR